MATQPALQVLSRKSNGISPAGHPPSDTAKQSKVKSSPQGTKAVIRRLPPGLTEEEFWAILGDGWKAGATDGRVTWASYEPGKVSQDPSKPPRPSRAYLHLHDSNSQAVLDELVRNSVWEDSAQTWTNPALILPPTVEVSIYQKTPSAKHRVDSRQGTIDSDPEFMAFLESLANPGPRKEADGELSNEDAAKPEAKATTTPLIEYLKEKKANKAKEAASSKGGKHSRQESKGKAADEPKKKGKDSKSDKAEKQKDAVKILTKKEVANAADAANAVASQLTSDAQKRRAAVAKMAKRFEKDLGLSPGNAHRKARIDTAKAEADAKAAVAKENSRPSSPTAGASSVPDVVPSSTAKAPAQSSGGRSRGRKGGDAAKGKAAAKSDNAAGAAGNATKTPIVLLKKKDDTPGAAQTPAASGTANNNPSATAVNPPTGPKTTTQKSANKAKSVAPATPSPGATRAFIKHANPSQGVTEQLLKTAFEMFGQVTFTEIDRRKGFAYVDFAEHEGLAKAMTASPVTVAQATVQVLERREVSNKKAAPATAPAVSSSNAGSAANGAPAAPAAEGEKAAPTASGGGKSRGGRGRGGRGHKNAQKGAKDGNANAAAASSAPVAAPAGASNAAG